MLGIFLMIVFSVLAGTILSWLYLRTHSPWAPALAHGSLNASGGLPILFLTPVDFAIGGTLSSAIGWIPLAAFVGWPTACRSRPRPRWETDLRRPLSRSPSARTVRFGSHRRAAAPPLC